MRFSYFPSRVKFRWHWCCVSVYTIRQISFTTGVRVLKPFVVINRSYINITKGKQPKKISMEDNDRFLSQQGICQCVRVHVYHESPVMWYFHLFFLTLHFWHRMFVAKNWNRRVFLRGPVNSFKVTVPGRGLVKVVFEPYPRFTLTNNFEIYWGHVSVWPLGYKIWLDFRLVLTLFRTRGVVPSS